MCLLQRPISKERAGRPGRSTLESFLHLVLIHEQLESVLAHQRQSPCGCGVHVVHADLLFLRSVAEAAVAEDAAKAEEAAAAEEAPATEETDAD